jgi:predicted DNA-binding transcriptional regulator YafY
MRHEKAGSVLALARRLAATAEGMTTTEIAQDLGVCRRTAERMRDVVEELFPALETLTDGATKRFRIAKGLDGFMHAPTTSEIVELSRAIDALLQSGQHDRAATLQSLSDKIQGAMRADQRRRMSPDIDVLARLEMTGAHAGPRPVDDPALISGIRQAILSWRLVQFRYHGGKTPGTVRTLAPFGLLFDRINYLVAAAPSDPEPRTWRLDRISDFQMLDEPGGAPEGFSIAQYAARSFGVYFDTIEQVSLRVLPNAADDAKRWRFHPSQVVEEQPDGSVLVSFQSSGMLELAWHLFTWRGSVEVLGPDRLKATMVEELQRALARHDDGLRPIQSQASEMVAT